MAPTAKNQLKEPCVTSRDGERFAAGITDGTLAGYKYFALSCKVRLTLTVRGMASGRFNAEFGRQRAELAVLPGGEWKEYACTFTAAGETYPLYLRYSGKGIAELKTVRIEEEK